MQETVFMDYFHFMKIEGIFNFEGIKLCYRPDESHLLAGENQSVETPK